MTRLLVAVAAAAFAVLIDWWATENRRSDEARENYRNEGPV